MLVKPAATDPLRVLFVCTANICRSPMALALLRLEAEKNDLPVKVASAGLLPGGHPAEPRIAERVARVGGTLDSHVSRELTDDLVNGADFILAMTAEHVVQIVGRYPKAMPRVHTLPHFVQTMTRRSGDENLFDWATSANLAARQNYASSPAGGEIKDPISEPDLAFDFLLEELQSLIGWFARQLGPRPQEAATPVTSTGFSDSINAPNGSSDLSDPDTGARTQTFLSEVSSAADNGASVKNGGQTATKKKKKKRSKAKKKVQRVGSSNEGKGESNEAKGEARPSRGFPSTASVAAESITTPEGPVDGDGAGTDEVELIDLTRSSGAGSTRDVAPQEVTSKFEDASEGLLVDTMHLVLTSQIHKDWDDARIEFRALADNGYTATYHARRGDRDWQVTPSESAQRDAAAAFAEFASRMREDGDPNWETAVFTVQPDQSYEIDFTVADA